MLAAMGTSVGHPERRQKRPGADNRAFPPARTSVAGVHPRLAATWFVAAACLLPPLAAARQQEPAEWAKLPRMQLERQFAGSLQDTVIQRWRDPVDGTICTIYLPIMALHSPQTASGYVQYGPNTMGSISCTGTTPAATAPPNTAAPTGIVLVGLIIQLIAGIAGGTAAGPRSGTTIAALSAIRAGIRTWRTCPPRRQWRQRASFPRGRWARCRGNCRANCRGRCRRCNPYAHCRTGEGRHDQAVKGLRIADIEAMKLSTSNHVKEATVRYMGWFIAAAWLPPLPAAAQQQQPMEWAKLPRMQLERQFAGPLQDTIIQRWRDPVDGTICYIYLPITAGHSPPTASGYVQYGPNTIGSMSCLAAAPAAAARGAGGPPATTSRPGAGIATPAPRTSPVPAPAPADPAQTPR
jgi:hypothetical protein